LIVFVAFVIFSTNQSAMNRSSYVLQCLLCAFFLYALTNCQPADNRKSDTNSEQEKILQDSIKSIWPKIMKWGPRFNKGLNKDNEYIIDTISVPCGDDSSLVYCIDGSQILSHRKDTMFSVMIYGNLNNPKSLVYTIRDVSRARQHTIDISGLDCEGKKQFYVTIWQRTRNQANKYEWEQLKIGKEEEVLEFCTGCNQPKMMRSRVRRNSSGGGSNVGVGAVN
jgi:hypothetical protein